MRKPAGATLLLTLLSLLFSATFVKAEGTSENTATTDSVPLIVRQITLIGNKKTRDGIVYRELNFAVGDTLHVGELKKRFERSENNLFNTQLFNSIDITWLQDQSDMRIFVILQERWYIFPIPIFEVAERNFNAWWKTKDFSRVVYGMALSWRNVTGRNDLLTGTLRLGYTQRMSLSYSLPFIDRQRKIGMSVSGFYLRNREIQIMAIDNELVNFKEENRYAKKEYGGNFGLTIRPGTDFPVVNPDDDPRYRDYWETYHSLLARRGVSPDIARAIMRTNTTAIGAIMVHREEADSLICGTFGQFNWHLGYVRQILARGGLHPVAALSLMILEDGPLFIADTHVHPEPSPEQIMDTVIGAAQISRKGTSQVSSGPDFTSRDLTALQSLNGALRRFLTLPRTA